MAKELTPRQKHILDFLIESIRERGFPPTIAEIGAAFKIASTNAVNDHLLALEKKGYIERSSKARGIRITDKACFGLYHAESRVLPLLGQIAAGQPLLAEEQVEGHVTVDQSLAKPGAYCLRVHGDSMIEDGILEGDIIIVDGTRRPRSGDIVVALIQEEETTVKRLYPLGKKVELRPANAAMTPMQYPASQVSIQGVVVGLQRTF